MPPLPSRGRPCRSVTFLTHAGAQARNCRLAGFGLALRHELAGSWRPCSGGGVVWSKNERSDIRALSRFRFGVTIALEMLIFSRFPRGLALGSPGSLRPRATAIAWQRSSR